MFDEKLVLREKMKDSWLIQRLHAPYTHKLKIGDKEIADNPFSFGGGLRNGGLSKEAMDVLRGVFSFDYMGSAEFEWGAVPQALAFLAEQSTKGGLVAGTIFLGKNNDRVFFLSPKSYEAEVKKRIEKLYNGESLRLKEHCGLNDYFFRGDAYSKRNLGWLELDNGFAFFVDKDMFQKFGDLLFGVET